MTKVSRDSVAGRAYLDLQNLGRRTGRPGAELMQFYALEGFLARLVSSPHAKRLVLKGGVLLAAFGARRPTRDVDLAAQDMDGDAEHLLRAARQIARVELDDGLLLDPDRARAELIRESDAYPGVRITMPCKLATASVSFHVDFNVGDPILPPPAIIALPRVLGGSIDLLGYSQSMVLAEKIVTALERGLATTRWRDFADILFLSDAASLDAAEMYESLAEVASHRGARLTTLADAVAGLEEVGQGRWESWRSKVGFEDRLPRDLGQVLQAVAAFADPVILRRAGSGTWDPHRRSWNG
ncbi:nucleotidyl transferase AbiEii/AbiGii toxin family protein [Sporichthya polymorpha]|uniref:nucleotidyl transferase AbiEii/AbiGii toxin family protein n=1 Tax=Sporichthya polymorpha TaxID=35751 RepID=UPI00037C7AAC|nr:nucleotidyl transferase AbiEii/AbiGii toxin family protein [Sporichthya polymorpha]